MKTWTITVTADTARSLDQGLRIAVDYVSDDLRRYDDMDVDESDEMNDDADCTVTLQRIE